MRQKRKLKDSKTNPGYRNPSFINLEDLKFFCKEKGFAEEDFFKILASVIKRVLEEKIDQESDTEVLIEDGKTVRVYNHQKIVVEDAKYASLDDVGSNISFISLTNAKKQFGEDVKVGDQVKDEVFLRNIPWLATYFSEEVSKEIKRLHCSKLRETYESLIGETLRVSIVSKTREGYLLKNTESPVAAKIFLSNYDVRKGKEPKLNEVFEVYVKSIDVSPNGTVKVIVSTISDKLLKEVLNREVPELREGIIKIVGTATSQQHNRSKIAVARVGDTAIEPIGCFVGNNGSRMRAILNTLKGLKLDVLEFKENKIAYVAAALSPAKVISVIPPKRKQSTFTVIVPDEHHPLAIGVQGSNVALASLLTNTNIDLIPLSKAEKKGIKINWNGNITPQELEIIKQGKKAPSEDQLKQSEKKPFTSERKRRHRDFRTTRFEKNKFSRSSTPGEIGFTNFDPEIIEAELEKVRFNFDDLEDFEDISKTSNYVVERRVVNKNQDQMESLKSSEEVDPEVLLGIGNDEREDLFDQIEEDKENWG